jgi:hypothetical protein
MFKISTVINGGVRVLTLLLAVGANAAAVATIEHKIATDFILLLFFTVI